MNRCMELLRTALLALALPTAAIAQSQGAQIALGGVKQDHSLPVQVTSDELSVNQTEGTAVFTGHVIVVQGKLRLTAPWVKVEFAKADPGQGGSGQTGSGQAATAPAPAAAAGSQITRVHATGGVTLTDGAEDAEGREAVYTVADGVVVMTGDVVLTQGQNAMAGQKLEINLNTGIGVMRGRVQTVFRPAPGQKP